jgi:GrpB-like predicted nucleotidyltransferase (UPF0157 family)
MSLCVAWKYEDEDDRRIYFASDSCAVVRAQPHDHVMPYGGIKVLEIPVRVISAFDAATQKAEIVYSGTYGMAFAGVYFAAFVVKELVSEVLTHVQFLGAREELSFDVVCETVATFYGHYYNQIRDHLPQHYLLDFLLGGYCPRSGRIRVAKFWIDHARREPRFAEVLRDGPHPYATIGVDDGQARFQALMDLSLSAPPCRVHFAAFRRLWDVIRDPEIRCVKGAVQYGEFVGRDFKLAGAFDVRVENGHLTPRTFVRGTDVDAAHNPGLNGLHLHYSFGNPFDDDIRSFDVSSFWEADGTRHVIDEQITVVPHSTNWSQRYREELELLHDAGLDDGVPVEHIGSTAVAGLAAVPCVDILIGADIPGDIQTPALGFNPGGYEYLGNKGIDRVRCYRTRRGHAFNLFVAPFDGDFWRKAIGLRDYLRQHPDECEAYGREKVRILNQGSWTLVRYLKERSNYLDQLLVRAEL